MEPRLGECTRTLSLRSISGFIDAAVRQAVREMASSSVAATALAIKDIRMGAKALTEVDWDEANRQAECLSKLTLHADRII